MIPVVSLFEANRLYRQHGPEFAQQLNEAKMLPSPTLSFAEPVQMRLHKNKAGDI